MDSTLEPTKHAEPGTFDKAMSTIARVARRLLPHRFVPESLLRRERDAEVSRFLEGYPPEERKFYRPLISDETGMPMAYSDSRRVSS